MMLRVRVSAPPPDWLPRPDACVRRRRHAGRERDAPGAPAAEPDDEAAGWEHESEARPAELLRPWPLLHTAH